MAATRSGSKGKGKARAVSPRTAAASRPSAARVATACTTAGRAASLHALNAATSAEDENRPYEDEGKSRSIVRPRIDGSSEESVVTDFHRFIGGCPMVICLTTTTTTDTAVKVLYDKEAAAFLANTAAETTVQDEDPFTMVISRGSSPEPPASLNDTEVLNWFDRRTGAQVLVNVTKEDISTKITIKAADQAFAQKLQESEYAALYTEHNAVGASTSRRMTVYTLEPATPMDITPNPTPVIVRTAPTSPTPSGRAAIAPDHAVRSVSATSGLADDTQSGMIFNPASARPVGGATGRGINTQRAMPPPVNCGAAALGQGIATRTRSASSRQPSAGPSTAHAGPPPPPAYSKDAVGASAY